MAIGVLGTEIAGAVPRDGQVFDHWSVRCERPRKEEPGQCYIFQEVVTREERQRVLQVAIGYLPDSAQPIALLTLPLGISLPRGAILRVDNEPPVRFPIERCELKGCRGGLKLRARLVAALRTGTTAEVTFHDASRQPISVTLSLRGLAAGLDALP